MGLWGLNKKEGDGNRSAREEEEKKVEEEVAGQSDSGSLGEESIDWAVWREMPSYIDPA